MLYSEINLMARDQRWEQFQPRGRHTSRKELFDATGAAPMRQNIREVIEEAEEQESIARDQVRYFRGRLCSW